jgi:hypothetical protein
MPARGARKKILRLLVAQTNLSLTAHWPRFGAAVGSSVAVVSWMCSEELLKREKIVSTLPSKCRTVHAAWLVDHPLTLDAPRVRYSCMANF